MPGIYVISHPKHMALWKKYRAAGIPIISSWIDDLDNLKLRHPIEWLLREQELYRSSCCFAYSCCDDLDGRGLLEIGMAMGLSKTVFALGRFRNYAHLLSNPQFSFKPFPEWDIQRTLTECHNWDRTGVADDLRTSSERKIAELKAELAIYKGQTP